MKILVVMTVMAILLSAFYMTMTKVVMNQIEGLQDFYANMDKYSSRVAEPGAGDITSPDNFETVTSPIKLKE